MFLVDFVVKRTRFVNLILIRSDLRVFGALLEYADEAHKSDTKEKIVDMALNGSGIRDRDTVQTLKVGIIMVIQTLKTRIKTDDR
ncbi:hypothetical protein GCM10023078_38220 [Gibbsiella greigii]